VPTFLVTRNMSPALAARVQAAVSGTHAAGGRRKSRLKAWLRALTVLFVLGAALGTLQALRRRAQELGRQRDELSGELARHAAGLSRADRELPGRVSSAVALETSAAYAGDRVDSDLRDERRLDEALSRPTLYLRGPLAGLKQASRVTELAASSTRDAFLLCLLAPPDTRTEKALRIKASAAYAQGPSMQVTSHVERVVPLLQGLPLLGTEWQARVNSAETLPALHTLAGLIRAAPLAAAVRAVKARQLLLVLDEEAALRSSAELDGERAHSVRVAFVDLSAQQTRLRFRGNVDPGWLSDATRAQYASGIDGCALAMDLRKSLPTLPHEP
jgi:hypothetical protein